MGRTRGLQFTERRPKPALAKKYGDGPSLTNVVAPPVSIALQETWQEAPGTSDSLTPFMKSVSRPLVPQRRDSSNSGSAGNAPPFTKTSTAKQPLSARSPSQTQAWKTLLLGGKTTSSNQASIDRSPGRIEPTVPLTA